MVTKSILVFDICSSTVIVDALHRVATVDRYYTLLNQIERFLQEESEPLAYQVSKFVGDGFILLFDAEVQSDDLLFYSMRLTIKCNQFLREFLGEHLPNTEMPRIGITSGLDQGWLVDANVMGKPEFVGRAINVACRLQGALDQPKHANKVMLTNAVRTGIANPDLRLACYETYRKLKNLDKKKNRYFEFEPLAFENQQFSRDVIRNVFDQKIADDESTRTRLVSMFKGASAQTIVTSISSLENNDAL